MAIIIRMIYSHDKEMTGIPTGLFIGIGLEEMELKTTKSVSLRTVIYVAIAGGWKYDL